ncbi:hypothetical protein BGZ83_007533 [Gryganskiella cystojenkinii]|nr:hypothetical protein BGZ83_007533 [Gryganskiella cystojenkinii]
MKAISLILVAALALVAAAGPTAKPLDCACGGKRDPWHPACCKDSSNVAPKVVAAAASADAAKPLDCACGGKRDPWHPACCKDTSNVAPKVV